MSSSQSRVVGESDGVGGGRAFCDGVVFWPDQADFRSFIVIRDESVDGSSREVSAGRISVERDEEGFPPGFNGQILSGGDVEGDDLAASVEGNATGVGGSECDFFGDWVG